MNEMKRASDFDTFLQSIGGKSEVVLWLEGVADELLGDAVPARAFAVPVEPVPVSPASRHQSLSQGEDE